MGADRRSFEEVVEENRKLRLRVQVAEAHVGAIHQALAVVFGEEHKSSTQLIIRTAAAILSRGI